MNIVKSFLLGFATLAITTTATANLDDQMRKSFDSLVNRTPAGEYNGQTRGVITGGNLYVRSRIVSPELIAFKAPSLKGGCGGIDIYKGSLSFISAVEFEQLLQAIAANARGYAFQLALDVLCPTCSANMKELQKKIQEMTAGLTNSCELAQKGINKLTPPDDVVQEIRQKAATVATSVFGVFDDIFSASPAKTTGGNPTEASYGLSPAQKDQSGLSGNVVWKALLKNNVANWYSNGSSSNEFNEILMDLAGTVIVTNIPDGATGVKIEIKEFSGSLQMKDFLHGTNGVASAKIMKCDSYDEAGCLSPGSQTIAIEGMEQKVNNMLLGAGASVGILAKLRDKSAASTFSPQERLFITAASPGILGVLRDFAHDTRAARAVSDIFIQTMAQEMTISFVTEMIASVRTALANAPSVSGAREKAKAVIERSEQNIQDARMNASATLAGVTQAFQVAAYMRTTLKSRIDAEREPAIVGN